MPADLETGMFRVEYPVDVPWHQLGVYLNPQEVGLITSDVALKEAELDWEVQLVPNYLPGPMQTVQMQMPDGSWQQQEVQLLGNKVPDDFSVIRSSDNKVLGKSVGAVYAPIQNVVAFQFLDSLVEEGVMFYESAGSLRGGEVVWMLGRIAEQPYKVKGVDPLVPYILGTNAHNGQRSFRILGTSTRVVCANTLAYAVQKGRGQGVAIQHSGDVVAKTRDALRVFAGIQQQFKDFTEQAELLASYQVKGSDILDFTEMLYPSKADEEVSSRTQNKRDELFMEFSLGDEERSVRQIEGTAWDLFNAVTRITNHKRQPKISSGRANADAVQIKDARLDSLWFGTGDEMNQKALNYLVTLAAGRDMSAYAAIQA